MGLSLVFDEGPGSPGVSDRSNNRLSARVDMDVLDDNPLQRAFLCHMFASANTTNTGTLPSARTFDV